MPTLDERVAYLEGKTEDHSGAVAELRTDVREARVELREVRGEIQDLRVEIRGLRDQMDRRFEILDQKVDRHFTWLVGIQVASLLAFIGGLLRH